MTQFNNHTDLIDALVGLEVGSNTYAARHFRDEVLTGTQESYEALFDRDLTLPIETRYLVALYASLLSNAKELSEHYLAQIQSEISSKRISKRISEGINEAIDEKTLQAVLNNDLSQISDPALKAILLFTRTLTLNPIEGDQNALLSLQNAGISTPDSITIAQLIAFLSYQIRLVTGLKAMKSLEG